jgi:hypothetical protein
MLKKLATLIILVLGVFVLDFSYYRYHSRIVHIPKQTTLSASSGNSDSLTQSSSKKVEAKLYANLPQKAQEKLKNNIEKGKVTNLTLLVSDNSSVTTSLKNELENSYGKNVWNVKEVDYHTSTSTALISQNFSEQVSSTQPDIILYEVPLLNDNMSTDEIDSKTNNDQILTLLAKTNAAILVEPSQPIYQGVVYPAQEKTFEEGLSKDYSFVDYWSAFPATDSDDMKKLVVDDGVFHNLNDAGNKIWSTYLNNYFIAK